MSAVTYTHVAMSEVRAGDRMMYGDTFVKLAFVSGVSMLGLVHYRYEGHHEPLRELKASSIVRIAARTATTAPD